MKRLKLKYVAISLTIASLFIVSYSLLRPKSKFGSASFYMSESDRKEKIKANYQRLKGNGKEWLENQTYAPNIDIKERGNIHKIFQVPDRFMDKAISDLFNRSHIELNPTNFHEYGINLDMYYGEYNIYLVRNISYADYQEGSSSINVSYGVLLMSTRVNTYIKEIFKKPVIVLSKCKIESVHVHITLSF